VQDLLLFDAKASALNRVKVTGQIVHERAGEYFMMNGTNGLSLFLKKPVPLQTGDFVEAVGFPMLGNASPVLRDTVVRRTGKASLPEARRLVDNTLLNSDLDATVVRIESKLVGVRSVPSGQELELQTGTRTFVARLDTTTGLVQPIPVGSRLRLTGVYAGRGGDRSLGRGIDSFELLLNAPADVKILERPSWWTIGHTLAVVGALMAVLLLALAWIMGLRRQVNLRTRQLRDEIEEHKRTEIQLTREIEVRKQMEKEIEHVHRQLLDTSRRAGMAEIATNVLHNVGNVLNSVNVTTNLLAQRVRKSRVSSFPRVVAMLQEHAHDLGAFITSDAKGKLVPDYLAKLSENLLAEQEATIGELNSLRGNVEHINEIVSMQQNYASVGGVKEIINVVNLVEDCLRINEGALSRHHVEVVREFENVPPMNVDKHKLLQILVNLVRNAKYACQESERVDKQMTVRVANGDGRIKISVIDNGVGIPPENLTRIFNHGFTTRKDGHGFGLHSGALAAKEIGGSLNVHSDGPGQGAAFTLELPCPAPGGPA
jgi:signal transduction histidine kinase